MSRTALKIGLIVFALGVVVQEANAFGHHHRGSGGYGYGGCGGGGCGYGGYGGYGYGGYGYGGWGYPGYGGWVPGGYLAVSSGGYASPAVAATASNSVRFIVSVPADAKVFVNGHLTTSTGERRQFQSTGVQPSVVYPYQVRAEFVRDGKPVSEEKTVQLTAGQIGSVEFAAAPKGRVADVTTSAPR